MKNIFAFVLLVPLFSIAEQIENVVIVKKPTEIIEGTSEFHRMNKNHQVTLQLIGVNPNGLPGGGLTYGYFLDRNSMILAEFTASQLDTQKDGYYGSGYNTEGSSVGVHFKRIFGNSFYIKAGIDQRHTDLKYNYNSSVSSNFNTSYGFKSDSTAASFVIGNQWQWNNFTLGCDWIGMSVPFIESTSGEFLSANADRIDVRNLNEDKRRLNENGIAQGLRFYLGASF